MNNKHISNWPCLSSFRLSVRLSSLYILSVTQSSRHANSVTYTLANTALVWRSPLNIKAHPFDHLLSTFNTTVQFAFLSSERTWSHICYQATDFPDRGVLPYSACQSCQLPALPASTGGSTAYDRWTGPICWPSYLWLLDFFAFWV